MTHSVNHNVWQDRPTRCACCDERWDTRAEYEDHVLYMMAMDLDKKYEEAYVQHCLLCGGPCERLEAHLEFDYGYSEEDMEDEMADLRKAALNMGQP